MRCSQFKLLGMCFVALSALACAGNKKLVVSRAPLSEEQLSVYRGFLDKFSTLNFNQLSSMTIRFDFKGFPETRPCLKGIDLEDASAALNTVHILGDEITKGRELRLVTPSELSTILDRDPISSTDKNLGVLVLSEVVFDANHRYAVLKYEFVCGNRCGSGATLVMEKIDGRWTISSRPPCAAFVGSSD